MATEPEAILEELNEVRSALAGGGPMPVTPELLARLKTLAGKVTSAVGRAKATLEKEIHATASGLEAKATAMRQPPPVPAAPPVVPDPWEDHQGLDPAQLQKMVEALQRKPHS